MTSVGLIVVISILICMQCESTSVFRSRSSPAMGPPRQMPYSPYRYAARDAMPMRDTYPEEPLNNESPKLIVRKFTRSQKTPPTSSQNQARFWFPWLFGSGSGYDQYPPPPPPYPGHGPEYCVEIFDPHTGYTEEECTPIY